MPVFPFAFTFAAGGIGINGATVNAYDVSRFSGQPALNASPPGGSPDAGPVTTGVVFGSEGSFTIDLPTSDQYYISVTYEGQVFWMGPVEGAGTTGGAGNLADKSSMSPQVFVGDVVAPRVVGDTLTAAGFIGIHNGSAPPNGTYEANDWSLDFTTPAIWTTPGGGVNPTDWISALVPFITVTPLLPIYMAS